MRPYTRSLHPDDYAFLPRAAELRLFQQEMVGRGVPHREWCEHRLWEYASMLQQLEALGVPADADLIDVGAGASFFDPYLALRYPRLCCTDSMAYGDVTAIVAAQRAHYGVALPLYDVPLEDMTARPAIGWHGADASFDVTLCISTIEHVDADRHDDAMRELVRITKPGGYLFITTDYFRDLAQWDVSPSKFMQHTPYTKSFALSLPSRFPVDFVGDTDLDYCGDFVHNHSFANLCLQKRAA